jgi:hypothetical protein
VLLLQAWSAQGKHGIWLKVPIALSQLIPVAVEPGFTFHHAEKVGAAAAAAAAAFLCGCHLHSHVQ